jgi:NADPH-dependent 2,4-dienoyl-CoA reductase/sulfur reductase-like enzyme
VGGGPAGLSAARAYREHGGLGPVRIISADPHPPYHRPPLSKGYLAGSSAADELPLEDEAFYRDHDIEVVIATSVAALDLERGRVTLEGGQQVPYDACVLATGCAPATLPVDGADHPDVLSLRSREHGEELRARAERARTALVVGSGFIGCEAAATLARRGLRVTLVSDEDHPQARRLGAQVADRIETWLLDLGVDLVTGIGVAAIRDGHELVLEDGQRHEADLVLVAAGVVPQVGLAERAGLSIENGRVKVDARMRTSAARVLAAGDVAFAHNRAAGRSLVVEHWGEALRMGEVAGITAAGGVDEWSQAPGFWSEVGEHQVKYVAWGDGFDDVRLVEHGGSGAFTAWYGLRGTTVGVLTHDRDEDYERGRDIVEAGAVFDDETWSCEAS